MKKNDRLIVSCLRKNARMTTAEISEELNMPISTVSESIRHNDGCFLKHSSLIDFKKLGYDTRATMTIKVEKDDMSRLRDFLLKCPMINSAYRVDEGFDFLVEGIFFSPQEMADFIEEIETNFCIDRIDTHLVLDEIKKEGFMIES